MCASALQSHLEGEPIKIAARTSINKIIPLKLLMQRIKLSREPVKRDDEPLRRTFQNISIINAPPITIV